MRGRRWLAVAIAAGSITTGVAIAGSGKSETTAVMGTFKVEAVGKVKERQCDAKHVRTKARFEGPLASSDSRLAGQLDDQGDIGRQHGERLRPLEGHLRAPPDLQPRRVASVVSSLPCWSQTVAARAS